MIGKVEKVETDERGRAWGSFLRVRIDVDITEPLMRWVGVESPTSQETVYYEVKYEKLPIYCFSCGLLGHPSVTCPNPASRDEDGQLPWNKDRVCVPEEWRKTNSGQSSQSGQGSSNQPAPRQGKKNPEVRSPVKPRKPRARKNAAPGTAGEGAKAAGLKHKQVYLPKNPVLAIEHQTTTAPVENSGEVHSDGLNKK
jgi:hypothetical protein